MSNEQQTRFHATVHGRVQGVGFRAYVIDCGQALGVTGWARNRWNGTVEVVAEGEPQKLERLLEAIRRGPRMSLVTKVDVEWEQAIGEFKSFGVRSTI